MVIRRLSDSRPRPDQRFCKRTFAAVTRPPQTPAAAKAVRELLDKSFSPGPIPDDLTARRPDTLLLVTSWFLQNPEELEQTLSPAEAEKRCQIRRRAK